MTQRMTYLVVALALAIGLAGGAALYAVTTNRTDIDRNTAVVQRVEDLAKRAQENFRLIQKSRLDQCLEANKRYQSTIAEINRQVNKLPPARRKAARANSENTRIIIAKLTGGNRNCHRVVR